MSPLIYLITALLFVNKSCARKSFCSKYFSFEPDKAEEDRWFGVITLISQVDVQGVTLELHFDKPVIQLGNWLGGVKPNSDNTIFKIRNDKPIRANTRKDVKIYAVFDPYYDIPAPQLTRILFNGREICPRDEEQISYDVPAITVNINIPNCGLKKIYPTALITYGQNTIEGQWPWHAALYSLQGRKKIYICGGTLISEKHILTAAHCTTYNQNGSWVPRDANTVLIILGKYGTYIFGKHEQPTYVSAVIVHPNFNWSNLHNDISILVTSNPVQITDYVRPICLWEEAINEEAIVNRIGSVVGWGRDEKNNAITDVLMEATMPVVSRLKCVLSQGTYYARFTTENTLCAGFRNGTSVCNGDSGGGLVFPKTGTSGVDTVWQIRGIVSNTLASDMRNVCDPNYYAIFTDVAKYLDWIKQNTR